MTWYPIAFLPPQLENTAGIPYSGAVLKAYLPGTTTNIPMATDYTGATTAASMVLNAAGYVTQGGNIVIPHISQNYKLALYPTQAAANLDSGAIWTINNIKIAGSEVDSLFNRRAIGAAIVANRTNCYMEGFYTTGGTSLCMNSRYRHYSQYNNYVSEVRLVFGNYAMSGSPKAEVANGNDIIVRCAIEEQSTGTKFPVTFNGDRDVVIAPGGIVFSDPLPNEIVNNTFFYTRTSVAIVNPLTGSWPMGEYTVAGLSEGVDVTTTYSDKTTSGVISTNSTQGYGPLAIIGYTNALRPGIVIVGDSILRGDGDGGSAVGDKGIVARALTNRVPYSKMCVSGEKAEYLGGVIGGNRSNRMAPHAFACSHVIIMAGTNDTIGGTAAATTLSNLQTLAQAFVERGVKAYICTIPPITTSSDSWATVGNQTVTANEAKRTALNDLIRALPAPFTGYYDIADALEVSRNSGKWKVNGVANYYTSDGIHPSTQAATDAAAVIAYTDFTF